MTRVPQPTLWFAVRLVGRLGPSAAARELGLSRQTLAAVCAGWPVTRETVSRLEGHRHRILA